MSLIHRIHLLTITIVCLFLAGSAASQAVARIDGDHQSIELRYRLGLLSNVQLAGESTPADDRPGGLPRRFVSDVVYAGRCLVSDVYHVYSPPSRINSRSALWVSGLLAVGGVIYIYDQEILDAFQRSKGHGPIHTLSSWGDTFYDVGDGGASSRYYVLGLAVGYVTGYGPLRDLSLDIVESYILAGSVKNVTNLFAGRSRPFSGEGPRMFRFNEGTSLPSGHASNVFQLARILSHHLSFKPFTVAAYTVATSVCIERLTSESHWPSDVYAGMLLGYFVADVVLKRNENRRLKITPTASSDGSSMGLAVSCGL